MTSIVNGIAIFVFGTYIICLIFITCFILIQFHLYYLYRKNLKAPATFPAKEPEEWPLVTVQLPIYNEKYVVERLIDQIAALDYPKDKILIQILDDSNDETSAIVREKVEYYIALGHKMQQIHRPHRVGYKAGALEYGISTTPSEFIAIFDADFLPEKDFLKRTLPVLLQNEKLALVQTRWKHINEHYSLLTRLQALQLNIHFTVEQKGRMNGDLFLQFNGTAGIWRKSAIVDSGGWQHDTLTEDLDLSYRAQLKGWKIAFMEECGLPAELPIEMSSFKSQQFRWMKGGAETAKKLLPPIWKSELPFVTKIHASVHLLGSSTFLFIFIASFLSVPSLVLNSYLNIDKNYLMIFLIGTLAFALIFAFSNYRAYILNLNHHKTGKYLSFLLYFPIFLAVFMGMSFHNTLAVFQGFKGIKSSFIRTPKFNMFKEGMGNSWRKNQYLNLNISKTTITEGILSLYFAAAVLWGIWIDETFFVFYHILLTVGFGFIFYLSVQSRFIK